MGQFGGVEGALHFVPHVTVVWCDAGSVGRTLCELLTWLTFP